ncbi:uncharacterized protein LOC135806996 [Sycon ciliatum]|uniref:uncharacterized protein LOC135806996 n=1 Tax=Sycon ciliatum TaxID=27933 RepID=UPI0031F61CDA
MTSTATVSSGQASKEIRLFCQSLFRQYPWYHLYSSEETTWVVVSVQAPRYQKDEDSKVSETGRAPLELVAVIDRSTSMERRGKFAMVKETMLFVIRQLNEHDKLGIVLYDEEVTSTGSLWRMDASGKAKATSLIEHMDTEVGTNLCGGLVEGLAMIEDLQKEKSSGDANAEKKNASVSSILLMTDGQADVGFTSQQEIIACLTQQARHGLYPSGNYRAHNNFPAPAQEPTVPCPPSTQRTVEPSPLQLPTLPQAAVKQPLPSLQAASAPAIKPVVTSTIANSTEPSDVVAASIYTFGFGANHNAELLQAVSKAGNGMHYYIDSSEKIPESFADCLGGLLSRVVSNVSLEVSAVNNCNIIEAYAGQSTQSSGSGVAITLPLADIQSKECRDCVFCLDLPDVPNELDEFTILKAKLTCFNVMKSMLEMKEASLEVRRVLELPDDLTPNPQVYCHYDRIKSAKDLESYHSSADKAELHFARYQLYRAQKSIASGRVQTTDILRNNPSAISLSADRELMHDAANEGHEMES